MWPSPFWLLYGDSVWRGFGDLGYHGAYLSLSFLFFSMCLCIYSHLITRISQCTGGFLFLFLYFLGDGSYRQQWITFRDAVVYKLVVTRSKLFPLSAIMLHGIVTGAVGQSRSALLNVCIWKYISRTFHKIVHYHREHVSSVLCFDNLFHFMI